MPNLYISRELIEPLCDDNSITLSTEQDVRPINDTIDKLLNKQSKIEENTLSDYVDVFISIGAQSKIFYGLPKDDVFTDNTLFNAIKENIRNTFGLRKDEFIFNRKGKVKEPWHILGFFLKLEANTFSCFLIRSNKTVGYSWLSNF